MRVSTRVVVCTWVCTLAAAELPTTTHVRVGAPVEGLPGKNVCSEGTNTDQVCCSHSLTLSALDAQMVAPTVATCLGDYRRQNTYWSINGATTYIGGDDANNIDSRPCEFHAVITNPTIHSPLTCVSASRLPLLLRRRLGNRARPVQEAAPAGHRRLADVDDVRRRILSCHCERPLLRPARWRG